MRYAVTMTEQDSSPTAVASEFYRRFQARDGEGMEKLYAPTVTFSDPVFPDLRGPDAGKMWRMLTRQGKDLTLSFEPPQAQGEQVTVAWTARYTFSATKRPVVNHVRATMRVVDGKIVEHRDDFDFAAWAAQAFGLVGKVLGGFGFFQRAFQGRAGKTLAAYRA